MYRFDIPDLLPPCQGILPAFKNRFSGWHLGMGLPDTLLGLLHGLATLAPESPHCVPVAAGMAIWGFEAHPLVPDMARWGLRLMEGGLHLPPDQAALMRRLAALPPLDEADTEARETWYALARQDDFSLIIRFLAVVLAHPAKRLTWLGHIWQDLLFLGRPELAASALDMIQWDDETRPLKARLEAERSLQYLSPDQTLAALAAVDDNSWGHWRAYAAAEALLRQGETDPGRELLAELWKRMPWHVNLTLKLHDLFNPPPMAELADTAGVAVLAYSWNKADLLADTLDSLAHSDIGTAKIFALDNGSTDHTPAVLSKAKQRFGQERFHVETLPVNVGAPAARNWLLSLPGVKTARWVAYLDDDVVLPKDWLLRLLGTAQAQPGIGAAGCRITAATPPFGLQSADYNLFPTPPSPVTPGELPNRVLVFDNCAGSTDLGLFTYSRPCLSVSGCCHMISRQAIDAVGGFDLRYTPSQFDDLDRDLRSALAGMPAVYAGGLAVRHVQHSSLAKSQTTRQMGHVLGNKFKLDTKYSDEDLATLGQNNKAALWADLEQKHAFLVDRLG